MENSSYSNLLTTLTATRAELERATTKINSLESENSALHGNYNQLKDELESAKKNYAEARENYHRLSEEKLERDKQNEAFVERLRAKLDEKILEQDKVQQFSNDAESLRATIREEIELPFKQKLRGLLDELDVSRDLAAQYKRECDKLKAEFAVNTENQRREVASIRVEHDSVVSALHNQIITLQEQREQANAITQTDSTLRAMRQKSIEQQALIDQLKAEVNRLISEKDSVSVKSIEFQSKLEENMAKVRARIVVAESERHAAEQKLSISLLDFDKKEALLRNLKRTVEELTADCEHLNRVNQELDNRIKDNSMSHNQAIFDLQLGLEAERHEHAIEVDKLNKKLAEREEVLRKAQREAGEQQQRAENLETEYKRSYAQQLQALSLKYQQLQSSKRAEANPLLSSLTDKQRSAHETQLLIEIEHLRGELDLLNREKDVLHERTLELENNISEGHKRYSKLQNELLLTVASLNDQIDSAHSDLRTAQHKVSEESAKCGQLSIKLDHLQLSYDQIRDEKQQLAEALRESKQQLQQSEVKWTEKCEQVKQSYKQTADKEKRRSEAYKQKAIEAHQKWKEAATIAATIASHSGGSREPKVVYLANAASTGKSAESSATTVNVNANLRDQAHMEALERKCEALELQISKQRIKEEDLIQSLSNTRLELQTINEQKQRVFDRVNELEATKKQLNSQLQSLEGNLRREHDRINELENAKQSLNHSLMHAESANKHSADKIAESESARKQLLLSIEGLEANLRRESDRVYELERKNKQLVQNVEHLELSVKREGDRAASTAGTHQQLQSQIATLEYSVKRESERANDVESAKRVIQLQLQTCEHSLRTEVENKNAIQQQLNACKDDNDKLKSRVSELEHLIGSLQQQTKQSHMQSLELSNKRQTTLELEHEVSLLREENSMLQQRLQASNSEMMALRAKPLEMTRQFNTELENLKADNRQLTRRHSDLTDEYNALKSKHLELSQRPDHERELQMLKTENSNLQRRVSELTQEVQANSHSSISLNSQLAALRDDNELLRAKLHAAESSRVKFDQNNNETLLQRQALENEVIRLQHENTMLKSRLNEVTPELLLLREQMTDLETAVMQEPAPVNLPTSLAFPSSVMSTHQPLRRSFQRG